MRGFTELDVKQSGIYFTKVCLKHCGCTPIDKADQKLMQSTKTTEEIAKALCVDEQVHGIGVEASRTKLYNEEGIFVSRKKARNLVEKADHEIREKAGTTELSDHDKMVEVLDNDPNIHYFMQVAVVDSISDKVQKTFTVLKVGKVRCMLGVACSMTYIL